MKKVFNGFPMPQFVPLWVPLERRIEMLGVVFFFTLMLQSFVLCGLFVWFRLWPLLVAYMVYICVDRSSEEGGRRVEWVRQLAVWRKVGEYFSMSIVREAELDPSKQYIFGYHPHGIIGNGAVVGFGTEALGFSKLFPGIEVCPLTLRVNFFIPFYRELALALGFCSVSKTSINSLFTKRKSCLIVVGGAEEALFAKPCSADLVLKKRMGFVAMAIKNGASLVPVYGFGENECFELYTPKPGSIPHRLQQSIKKTFGFTVPLCHGRNIFTYNYGFLPKRHPITVVGK
ncbi:diacylglycerol O-acyltransferase 1 [Entomophthora muscae]|uniref:Diacylglycerol O-acyltransferase 1 n=1 Tax=Entomophthora muscae TaxID=34485 RepID=A0ACC2TYM7_9FUNG|nr:diacylglycerol O-acyltransferase 1 [Entomophthora muscae]